MKLNSNSFVRLFNLDFFLKLILFFLFIAFSSFVALLAMVRIEYVLLFLLSALMLVFFLMHKENGREVFFSFIFYILFVFVLLQGISVVYLFPSMQVFQVIALLFSFLGFPRLWVYIKNSKILTSAFILYVIYVFFGVVSLFFSPYGKVLAGLVQVLANFKIYFMLAAFLYLFKFVSPSKLLSNIQLPYILISIVFLFVQWVFPSAYILITGYYKVPVELTGYIKYPGMSIFNHPSVFAAVSVFMALYNYSRWCSGEGRRTFFLFIFNVFLLISSNQRQEIFCFIISIYLLTLYKTPVNLRARSAVLGLFFILSLVGVFVVLFFDSFIREFYLWGGGMHASNIPRYLHYSGALEFAERFFPLGTGFGTWGGLGSLQYNLDAYYSLGMNKHWWWSTREAYIFDAFLPNILAETGWFGSLIFLANYFLIIFFCLKLDQQQSSKDGLDGGLAAASLLFVLLISPTSPAFQEVLLIYFPAMFFSAALMSRCHAK